MSLEEFIENLTPEDLQKINEGYLQKNSLIQTYSFSKIRDSDLETIVDISQKIDGKKFKSWFESNIVLTNSIEIFLEKLLEEEKDYIQFYDEEDLKMRFLSPLLLSINFKTSDFRDFYDEKITYETEKFILKGEVDFTVSTGLRKAEQPFFFIQEFKRAEDFSNPRPQLLAELISAIELNGMESMKGAYIVGENWNFVILEKVGKGSYQYFVSRTFNCTNREDLKSIYRNLLFIKNEIIDRLKKGQK